MSPISCEAPIENEVYYSVDDIIIKRIDQNKKTTLLYFKDGVPIDKIWITYGGFLDAWFDSGLYFLKDSTVMVSGSGWYRDKKHIAKRMFRIVEQDYPHFFKQRIINGKIHISATDDYKHFIDTMCVLGGYYNIVLVDPETEKELFNENNVETRVVVYQQFPINNTGNIR